MRPVLSIAAVSAAGRRVLALMFTRRYVGTGRHMSRRSRASRLPPDAAMVSYFLTDTNIDPTLADGVNYARVDIDDEHTEHSSRSTSRCSSR